MSWDRASLSERGFVGFVPFAALPESDVPVERGVYVIFRESIEDPVFLATSVGGHFKGKDPTADVATLQAKWVPGARVLNIGKASDGAGRKRGLAVRLDEYRQFGSGRPVGHYGGRYIWQLADHASLLVAWKSTPDEDPADAERSLLREFIRDYGVRPFANLTGGS